MKEFRKDKEVVEDPETYKKIRILDQYVRYDKFILIISVSLAAIILALGIAFQLYLSYITLSALIISVYSIAVLPYIFYKALEGNEKKKIEDEYISFLRDFSEALSSGMILHQALKHVSEIGYPALGKFIKKLYYWISWGIDFRKAFEMFNKYFEDFKNIRRTNYVILETYISGGDLTKILKSLADDLESIRDLEKLRVSYMRQQTLVMYVVFFVFIGMLIGILYMLKPMILQFSQTQGFGIGFGKLDFGMLKSVLGVSIIMEAISIAIINGYIESNKISGSFKHLAITSFVAILVYVIFILPPSVMIDLTLPIINYAGNEMDIGIKVSVDMRPINATAKLEIIGPSTYIPVYLNITDGIASFRFVPQNPGDYTIKVTVEYGGKKYTESRKITVQ